jgi:YVTN family beta-propeller protein
VTFTAPASDGGSAITAYTATCGARSATGNGSPISVIGLLNGQPITCTVAATNAVGTGPASPPSSAATPGSGGSFAFVPLLLIQTQLAVVDLDIGVVTGYITMSAGMSAMAASPDGARLYLVGPYGIEVIDTQSRTSVATIQVGTSPRGAVVSPDSTRIYVTNSGDNTVSVVDALSRQVVATIPVANQPNGIAITPDGSRLLVVHDASRTVSVIDTATHTVAATLTAGTSPIGVATSPDGRYAYVTGQASNDLTVIDVAAGSVVATVPTGARPYGVAVGRDSRRVYVTNADDASVSVIDATTRSVIATVPVGSNPGRIEVSADGSQVYVVAGGSSNLARISCSLLQLIVARTVLPLCRSAA